MVTVMKKYLLPEFPLVIGETKVGKCLKWW